MTDKCNEVRDALALEGKLPDDADMREHIESCDACTSFLKSFEAVEAGLDALRATDVDDSVVSALLERNELKQSARAARGKRYWAMGLAAAAVVGFVAVRLSFEDKGVYQAEPERQTFMEGSAGTDDDLRDRLRSLGYIATDNVEPSEEIAKNLDAEGVRSPAVPATPPPPPAPAPLTTPPAMTSDEQRDAREVSPQSRPDVLERKQDGRLDSFDREFMNDAAPEETEVEVEIQEELAARVGGEVGYGQGSAGEGDDVSSRNETFTVTAESPVVDTEPAQEGLSNKEDRLEGGVPGGVKGGVVGGLSASFGGGAYGASNGKRQAPEKLVHVEPVLPQAPQSKDNADKKKSSERSVLVQITIDAAGNVTEARVLGSVSEVPELNEAVLDAVRQWKYAPYDGDDVRVFDVEVELDTDTQQEQNELAARSFLDARHSLDGLRFRDARGYWSNTYIPGDPKVRFLAARLAMAQQILAPHHLARPVAQPLDPPTRGALSVSLRADRRSLRERGRLLVQVGVKATTSHGRRRPPMNVGIVLERDGDHAHEMRAFLDALQAMKAPGDRFRLILPGRGEVVPPESFRHGPLSLALSEPSGGSLTDAVRLAIQAVHAGDDPTMPLGTSLVLVATTRSLASDVDALARLAHQSAVGGVPVSAIGVGDDFDTAGLERLALSGQGRRYLLRESRDASRIVDDELAATGRTVARALRLRIKLADGVRLVDVLDATPLNERQSERVREAEKSIDLRLARNLGIDADRGEDEDGIQIVIPSFYAGDAHTILLDVVANGPGAIAEVTARYKDLATLENTVARASLSLSTTTATEGPLEENVLENYLALHLARELESAAARLDRGDRSGALSTLETVRGLWNGLPLQHDRTTARDIAMLSEFIAALASQATPDGYLADSLRYAGAGKRGPLPAST